LEYLNVPRTIASVVSSGKATMRDCQEFYSVEDIYDIMEIIAVDTHNRRLIDKNANKDQ
jgi:hypothetical protein